jgi:tetratricopeptide (TPR) repeat protein
MTLLTTLLLGWTFAISPTDTVQGPSEADAAFSRIDYPAALSSYLLALQHSPHDPQNLWKLARIHVLMYEVAPQEDQAELLAHAEEYAYRCISSDSSLGEGHTWLAASLAYQALVAGGTEQLRLSHGLLKETAKALELNPEDDVAYSIRGSFFRALGNASWIEIGIAQLFLGRVPDGGYEDSEMALQRAISLAPEIMRHHYELGVLYLDMGRREEAEKTLRHAATLPVRIASDRPRLVTIREILDSAFSENGEQSGGESGE